MDKKEADAIYAFSLPNVAEDVRFTCVFCDSSASKEKFK